MRYLFIILALIHIDRGQTRGGEFFGLGDLPGGLTWSEANGVSADGLVIVGSSESVAGREAYRWTVGLGMEPLGDLAGGSFDSVAFDVSANGSIIVGTGQSITGDTGFRWELDTGLKEVDGFPDGGAPNAAHAVSGDGNVVAGWSRRNSRGEVSGRWASRWVGQLESRVGAGDLPGGNTDGIALAISEDGSTIGGNTSSSQSVFPGEGFIWTDLEGLVGLGALGVYSVEALSGNGGVAVGWGHSAQSVLEREAIRWVRGEDITRLGDLPGGIFESAALDISVNGEAIVGWSIGFEGQQAVLWNSASGMRELRSLLVDLGLGTQLTGWKLLSATAISDDGLIVVGVGINPAGSTEAWRAVISSVPEPQGEFLILAGWISVTMTQRIIRHRTVRPLPRDS